MAQPVQIHVKATLMPMPWRWEWFKWLRLQQQRDHYYQNLRRIRLNARDWRARGKDASSAADVTFYTPNQIRHIIRWEPGPGLVPPPSVPPWPNDLVKDWRPWSFEPDATNIKLESRPTPTTARDNFWARNARGIPIGAAFFAVILLLLRAADRCLHTNLFKLPIRRIRSRQSDEWPTPDVTATSLRMTNDFNAARPSSPSTFYDVIDSPPPYSECTAEDSPPDTRLVPEIEEPPPPYGEYPMLANSPNEIGPELLTSQEFQNNEVGPSSLHDTGQIKDEDIGSPNDEDRIVYNEETRMIEDGEISNRVGVTGSVNLYVENIHNVSNIELKNVDLKEQNDRYLIV